MDNNDFILKIVAELEQKGIKTGFDKLKKELEKDPAKIDVILDTSGTVGKTKGSIKKLAAELHNELSVEINKLQKQGQDINFDLSVGDVEEVIQNVINHTKKLGESFDVASDKAQKFLAKFNKKSGGVLINSDEFKAVQEAINGLGNTHTIEDLNKAMNTLEVTYDNMSSKLRNSGKSLNPFINAKNEMATMDKTIEGISLEFDKLSSKPDDVANAIKELSVQQNKVNSFAVGTMEWADAYGHLQEMIRNVTKDISNLQKAQSSKSLQPQIDKIQLSMDTGDYDTRILAYETSLKKLGLTSQEISEKMKDVSISYKELKDSSVGDNIISDNVITKAKTLENEMSKLDNVVKQIKLKDSLQADDLQVEQTIIRLNNQLQKNSKYSKEAKDKIRAWISELEKGNIASGTLKQINVQAKELHSNMAAIGKTGQTFIQGIINKVKSLGTYISGTVIIGKMLQSGRQALNFAKELDKAMTNINYTMDVSSDKLSGIAKQSIDTAKDLKTSAENVLAAVTTYANANETAESILSKSKPTIMLSNVTGMDTATTTDILQGTIHQFDLEDTEEELYHVSDVLQAVSKSMAVDFSKGIKEMAEGIQVSGSVANDAGYDLERYSAILGNLIEKTRQSGSELGRSLRTMFVRTTKASTSALAGGEVTEEDLSNAESALRRVGIEVRDSKEEFRDFDAIMTDLYNKIDDLSEVDLSNIAYEVASTRQTAVFKVMVKTWGDYLNLSEQAYNASGETLENQEKYAASLQGKFEGLGSTVESIYSNLANSDDVGVVVDGFQKIADVIDFVTGKLELFGTIGTVGGAYLGAKGLG